jgi:hypothetical protein
MFGDFGGFWQIADWKLKSFLTIAAELNNQQLGKSLLF